MPNLNKVQLMGNLTRDPEIKFTPKGVAICEFGIAINRTWVDDNDQKQEETIFVDLTFFGKRAETIEKFVKKGQPIYVEGRLQLDQWEDKQSGQQRSKLKVIGEQFQFLSQGKREDKPGVPAGRYENAAAMHGEDKNSPMQDDDIPFDAFEKHSPLPM